MVNINKHSIKVGDTLVFDNSYKQDGSALATNIITKLTEKTVFYYCPFNGETVIFRKGFNSFNERIEKRLVSRC